MERRIALLVDKVASNQLTRDEFLRLANRPFEEFCDGSRACLAIPLKKDSTLLGDLGLCEESLADQFCGIVDAYMRGDIKHAKMRDLLTHKKVLAESELGFPITWIKE